MGRKQIWLVSAILACALVSIVASAQTPALRKLLNPDIANQNTVTIISGNPNGSLLTLAYDMSAVLDDEDTLRVLPVIGKGGYQNIIDVLVLRGVDLGITQSTIMAHLKASQEFGPGLENKLAYITTLYNEPMHVFVGPGINSLSDLNGKKCNYSDPGSGTQFSTRLIFKRLNINCAEVNLGQADGYLKVKSGELAATILIGGKPTPSFSKFSKEGGGKLLSMPYPAELEDYFFPTTFTHKDYPNLIAEGETVQTIAGSAVLVSFNWPREGDRYRRVAKFSEALFSKFDQFQKPPRHPGWRETNISAPLKGWKRFPAAQEWLDRNQSAAATSSVTPPPRVVAGPKAPVPETRASDPHQSQEQLMKEFLEWKRQQGKQ